MCVITIMIARVLSQGLEKELLYISRTMGGVFCMDRGGGVCVGV